MPVIAEIAKEFCFEAAHFLPNVPHEHKCSKLHGHSYRVIVRVKGPIDDENGWVMDLGDISSQFEPIQKELDHSLLNNIEGLENPTSEMLAIWIIRRLEKSLPQISSITIKATSKVDVTLFARQ